MGVGAAPLLRVSGGWGLAVSRRGTNFAGNLRGSSAARARTVATDEGHPRLSGQFGESGVGGTTTLESQTGVVDSS